MARKPKTAQVDDVKTSPSDEVRQQIANLCTNIGDRSFVIRQANSDIVKYYAEIDQLRDQLRTLEQPAAESPKA